MLNYSLILDRTFAALADPARRGMLARLAAGPASVSELAAPLPISLPAVLQHLQALEASGLIRSEKKGRVRTCRIEPQALSAAEALDRRPARRLGSAARPLRSLISHAITTKGDIQMTAIDRSGARAHCSTRRVDLVWKAWTDPEHIKQWWAPRPYQTTECEIDLTQRRQVPHAHDRPRRFRHRKGTACILEVVAGERIVWTSALARRFRPNSFPPEGCGAFPFTAIHHLRGRWRRQDPLHATVLHRNEEDAKPTPRWASTTAGAPAPTSSARSRAAWASASA